MTTVIMLGGNGYIGRNVIERWHAAEPSTEFIVVSRKQDGTPQLPNVRWVAGNADSAADLDKVLPARFDMICDFVGGMDPASNMPAAKAMVAVAATHGAYAMGYVQGRLGGRAFVKAKSQVAAFLKQQKIPTVIVNPTLVYGNGRHDAMSKMVPLLKFAGLFNHNLKPVTVTQVADELVAGMMKIERAHAAKESGAR